MKFFKWKSFKNFIRFEEIVFLILSTILLLIISFISLNGINKRYIQIRHAEIQQINFTINEYLTNAKNDFKHFFSLPENERTSTIVSIFDRFSDFYRIDSSLQISRIYKRDKKSRIAIGFSFSKTTIDSFLSAVDKEGSFSTVVRGIEDEIPSAYYAERHPDGIYIGRIQLATTNQMLSQIAMYSGSAILLVSSDGYIISSTDKLLEFHSLPQKYFVQNINNSNNLHKIKSAGKVWIPFIQSLPDLNIILVSLIPDVFYVSMSRIIFLSSLLFIVGFLTFIFLKIKQLDDFFLIPLKMFTNRIEKVRDGDYSILSNNAIVYNSEEIQRLSQSFELMAASIQERENSLRTSEQQFRDVINFFPVPISIILPDKTILLYNKAFTKTFGYDITDIPDSKSWLEHAYPDFPQLRDEKFQQWLNDAEESIKNNSPDTPKTYSVTCKDKSVKQVEFHMQKIGALELVILNDLTLQLKNEEERNRLNEQLNHIQKMDAIGQLAGGVAHDFNNVLAGIMGITELLLTAEPTEQERKSYYEMIIKTSERAADLTSKLLSFARKGKQISTPVNIVSVVNDTASILKRTIDKNISIIVTNEAKITTVIGDNSQLQNAFLNMGINAGHAMPNGGTLEFRIMNTVIDEDYCKLSNFTLAPGEYIQIEVRDNGCGMSPDVQKRLFEPFFTTKEQGKGTGLGLAAVYGCIHDHQGAVNVYSEAGIGTVFHIYLPSAGDSVDKKTFDEEIRIGSGVVLLVDDEEIIRITAKLMLERMGYEVLIATNGNEAIDTYNENKDSITLVILDMIMPVSGGQYAFEQIRKINPQCKIIVSSGFSKEESLTEMKKKGLNGFIRKPYRSAELSKIIDNVIKGIVS